MKEYKTNEELIKLVETEFNKLKESIKSIEAQVILKVMGYPNV